MFELAQNGDGAAVQEIMAKTREMGVDLEDFLKTLLGKWVYVKMLQTRLANGQYSDLSKKHCATRIAVFISWIL